MKFSAQEEYGLRCLMTIGRKGVEGYVTIPEISRREGLSEAHVGKLLMILRKGGFITSMRGQAGGYVLSRPAEQIIVGEALAVLGGRLYEDDFCDKHSGSTGTCAHSVGCSIKSLWTQVQTAVDSVVNHISLADIIEAEGAAPVQMFSAPPDSVRTRTLEVLN